MLLYGLMVLALVLTCTMFATKQMMLGFPSLIFWAILSGHAYNESTSTWDIYYFLFFASMGMAIFCALAMYGLRTKKEEKAEGDQLIDESTEEAGFIDEGEDEETSRQVKAVRDRANKRRTKGIRHKVRFSDLD